jgi:hypothetical protein
MTHRVTVAFHDNDLFHRPWYLGFWSAPLPIKMIYFIVQRVWGFALLLFLVVSAASVSSILEASAPLITRVAGLNERDVISFCGFWKDPFSPTNSKFTL